MANPPYEILNEDRRSNWVRLRTLIVLRWIAIAGQLTAIFLVPVLFDLSLNLTLCLLAVGVAIIANLLAVLIYPENKRLSETEVTSMMLFDMSQLSALLYLTGGLHNPFAMLLLVPVAIAATTLRSGPTIVVGSVAIMLATFVMIFNIPLHTSTGFDMLMPSEFVFGFWVALVIGVIFLGAYARRVTSEMNSMAEALLATQMVLAREQKINDLSGVIAAAAHELGTPLATIKLASSELIEDLADTPELSADASLIREQADRCAEILHSMGRAGKDDLLLRQAPLLALLKEAAEPHIDRGKEISFDTQERQPTVLRKPEIIHGLRTLIQNAVDFADSSVWIDSSWADGKISVQISDDGQGFPQHILGRIGDPFVRSRHPKPNQKERPEYQGMGLGLFIAKTLLERSGAVLTFSNDRDSGALVDITWPENLLLTNTEGGFGDNQPIVG